MNLMLENNMEHKSLSSVEFSKNVLKNTTILEIFNFNISVKSDFGFEFFSSVSSDLDPFSDLEVSSS